MSKIVFYPESELIKKIIPAPKKIEIPEWFKKIPSYQNMDGSMSKDFIIEGAQSNLSAKACMPLLDSFTTGYAFYTWADIQVRQINGFPYFTWGNTIESLSEITVRPDPLIPHPDGYGSFLQSWSSHWGIKTPKGYSCLLTHPLNRYDLPFITSTGIIDTDKWGIWGNQPFTLKKDFEGIIPAGTPIIQIIPFKREKWKSELDDSLTDWAVHENIRRTSKFRGYYKNKYWQKKEYE